jgi:shikimate dehydrogenase
MIITGNTKLAGVMGWPVSHSRSPQIHNYWAARHGLDLVYTALPVAPDNIGAAIAGLQALGYLGANVTVPHKQAVIPYLARLDEAAQAIGAVNTLVFGPDGIEGRNTDALGFMVSLREGAPYWRPDSGPAVVLGAGGAARAIAWALREAGAEVRIMNRTPDKAAMLAAEFGAEAVAWSTEGLAGAALLVNCTSAGLNGENDLELALTALPASAVVADIVYQPLETGLLKAARSRGLVTVDGLGMLLYQAQLAFAAWTGVMPAVDAELRALVLR